MTDIACINLCRSKSHILRILLPLIFVLLFFSSTTWSFPDSGDLASQMAKRITYTQSPSERTIEIKGIALHKLGFHASLVVFSPDSREIAVSKA